MIRQHSHSETHDSTLSVDRSLFSQGHDARGKADTSRATSKHKSRPPMLYCSSWQDAKSIFPLLPKKIFPTPRQSTEGTSSVAQCGTFVRSDTCLDVYRRQVVSQDGATLSDISHQVSTVNACGSAQILQPPCPTTISNAGIVPLHANQPREKHPKLTLPTQNNGTLHTEWFQTSMPASSIQRSMPVDIRHNSYGRQFPTYNQPVEPKSQPKRPREDAPAARRSKDAKMARHAYWTPPRSGTSHSSNASLRTGTSQSSIPQDNSGFSAQLNSVQIASTVEYSQDEADRHFIAIWSAVINEAMLGNSSDLSTTVSTAMPVPVTSRHGHPYALYSRIYEEPDITNAMREGSKDPWLNLACTPSQLQRDL